MNTELNSLVTPEKQASRTRCEIWNRVMGYHRPVSQFNRGKKSEFYSRKYFQAHIDDSNDSFNKQFGTCAEEPSDLQGAVVSH